MKLHVVIALMMSFACGVYAGDVFWDANKQDGTYDLSVAETWGGNMPKETDSVKFPEVMSSKNYTFTTTTDLCFERFNLSFGNPTTAKGDGNNITLDLGGDKVMRLVGIENNSTTRIDGQNSTLVLKSGTITQKEGIDYPRYFMGNIHGTNNKVLIDGADSRMILDAIKFVSKDSLFCVTNGGYVRGAMLGSQVNPLYNVTFQITGEGSMWDLHTNRVMTIDMVDVEQPLQLAQTALPQDVTLKVENKGVVTNFCGFIGMSGSDAKVIVDDAMVYGRDSVNVGRNWVASNNWVVVRNGGCLQGVQYLHVGQNGRRNGLRVDGSGSSITCGYFYVGHQVSGVSNVTEVTNGGMLKSTDLLRVGEAGSWNTLYIDGIGSTGECRAVYLGTETTAAYNTIEVKNGGVLNVKGDVWHEPMKKHISGFRPFRDGHDNRLGIIGSGSRLEFKVLAYVGDSGASSNNLIEVADDGLLYGRNTGTWAVLYFNTCVGNTIRVRDGGRIEVDQFSMGAASDGYLSKSNTLEIIGADSVVEARQLMYMNGIGNTTTISNGLLRVKNQGNLRFSDAEGRTSFLNLEGRTPRIEVVNYTNKNTKIVFKVPEGGFAEGPIIKATNSLSIDESCSVEIVAEHGSDGTAVLMQCANKPLDIADSVIANARFTGSKAKVYRVVKSADGKQLLLKPNNGTLVIFR